MLAVRVHDDVHDNHRSDHGRVDPHVLRLRDVLAGEVMHMVFQPVVDLRDGTIAGVEALARFELEPRRTPDLWFHEAWDHGLGIELELLAIRKALACLDQLPSDVYLAVNAAPTTLCSDALHDLLASVAADRIVVELTEHTRVDDYTPLQIAIARLRSRGTRLAIDDAGAGFSSFQHVLRLRPDIIKLDRSLTSGVDANPVRFALASALATFAGTLGARVCAEGIETRGELVALQRLGVEHGQGFLLARPAPLPLPVICGEFWATTPRRSAPAFIASPMVLSQTRLDALARTGLMDSDAEEAFDRLTRLASRKLGVPVSIVSLVDRDRQFFKSAVGLREPVASSRQTPLEYSFCRHVVTLRSTLVIDDTRLHPLVDDNPAIHELGVTAYAGVPLITADDQALGALCAIDVSPRAWTEADIEVLEEIAAMVVAQIDMRNAVRDRQDLDDILRAVFDQSDAVILLCTTDGRIERASLRFCEQLGYDEAALRGQNSVSLRHDDEATEAVRRRTHMLSGESNSEAVAGRIRHADGRWLPAITRGTIVRDQRACPRFLMFSYTLL